MKLITRDTDYALRAVCFIAGQKERVVAASELAEALKVPRPFLRKLLQVLNRKNVLISLRGIGGGFLLARTADKIYLTELIKIFQGPFSLNECSLKKKPCPERKICPLRKKICRIERYLLRELSAVSVGSLLKRK